MLFFQSRKMNYSFKFFVKSILFASVVVSINGYPQWVWNKDAIDLGNSGTKSSSSDTIRSPASGLGGIFGTVLSSIPQLASQAITGVSGIFNRPITLPGQTPGTNIGNDDKVPTTGSCKCVEGNACFLPNKATGSCAGGKVQCCSTSRTLFPEDNGSTKTSQSEKTVTQREVRRGLLKNILKGSGSIVDDTLDLFLHPFLSSEDQQKTAIRIFGDE